MNIQAQEELYNLITDNDLYNKSFDEFKTQFANPESQSRLYNGMIAEGLYPADKSEGEFTSEFFGVEKKNPIETEVITETQTPQLDQIEIQTEQPTASNLEVTAEDNTDSQQTSEKPKSSSGGGMMQMASTSASASQKPKLGQSQGNLLIVDQKKGKPKTAAEAELEKSKKVWDITDPNWLANTIANNPIKIDVPVATKKVAETAKNLAQKSRELEANKAQLDAEIKNFDALVKKDPKNPELQKISEELNKKIDAHNALSGEFKLDLTNLNQDRADLKKASAYEAIKNQEKGNFAGATWNSIVEGYKKIGEGQARMAIDLMAELFTAAGIPLSADKNMTKDEAKKAIISEINPALSKGYDVAKSKSTTQEYVEKQKKSGILPRAWFGAMESVPVMASGGPIKAGAIPRFVTGASLAYQYANEELDSNPNTANMDENERKKITVPIAIVGGILEERGFRTLISANKPMLIKLAGNIISKLPANATINTIKEVANSVLKNTIGRAVATTAGKLGTAYLGEAETGGMQRLNDITIKEIYDKANNVDFFKGPETFKELAKMVGEDANIEGIGGVLLRGIGIGASTAMSVTGVGQMSNEEYKAWKDLATDPAQGQLYLSKVISDLSSGRITQEEANKRINDFDRASAIAKQIPNNLSIEDQKKAFDIISENGKIDASIKDLQAYMEGKNPNLVTNINKQIEGLQKRIEDNNKQLTKLSENAVQKQTTSQVPVQPEAGTSQQVAEGEPQAEPQGPTQEGQGQEVARNESTVDNTIAADYLLTGGLNTIRSTDYLLKGIAGVFGKAGKLIDNIRNKYAKELSDNNLVDINNFLGTDTYDKIVSEIRDAIKQSYGENADIESIFNEVLQYPTGMPNRIGNNIESRIAALEGQGQEVESKLREQYGLEPLKPTYRGTTLDEWENVKNGGKFKSNQGFGENEEDVTWVSDSKEYSDEYVKSNENGVLIEFKPEAIDKSTSESGQQNDNTGVRLGRGLTLDDVQRVTDANGNVLYEAESKTTSKEGQGQEVAPSTGSGMVQMATPEQTTPEEDKRKIKSIFPDTKVDIVTYHDSDAGDIDQFRQDINGIWTTGVPNWWQKKKYKYKVALDIRNPKIISEPLNSSSTIDFFADPKNSEYDAIITTGIHGDMNKAVYVVRNSSQTKILGKVQEEQAPTTGGGGGMIQMATPEQTATEQVEEKPTTEQTTTEEEEPEEKPTEMSEKEWEDLQNLAERMANGEETDSDEDNKLQDKYPTTLNSLVAKKVGELPKQEAPEPTTKLSQGQKNAIKEGIKKAQDMVKRYPKQDDLLTKYRALKDFKKTNQEYINANQSQKDAMARKMNVELGLAPKKSAPSAQKILGQTPTTNTVDEAKALKDQLLLEAKAAESGKDFINNARKIIIDAVKNRTKGALSPKATKALLNALAGKIDTPKQRAEVIGKVIDIFKKSEDVVAIKESTLRDKIIGIVDKSIKEGQKNVKESVKNLATQIKSMLPKGVFSTAQVAMVANALASNLLNPKTRDAAVERLQRLATNVAYATKLKKAYDLRTKIKNANTENLAPELSDIAKGFAKINPKHIDDLDTYISEAEKVFDAVKPLKVKNDGNGNTTLETRSTLNYASSQDYVQKQLDNQEEILKQALMDQHQQLVADGKIKDTMSLSQMKAYIKSLDQNPENKNDEKEKLIKDFAEQSFKESKETLRQALDDGTIDPKDIETIKAFLNIDPSIMLPLDAMEAAEAALNYIENGSTSGMGKVASSFMGSLGAKTISESISRDGKVNVGGSKYKIYKGIGKALDTLLKGVSLGKIKSKIGDFVGDFYSDTWLEYNTPINNLGTTFFGPDNWDKIREAAGIDQISAGVVARKKAMADFGKKIYDKYKDQKVDGNNVFTQKVANMIGVVANLYRETSDPNKQDEYFKNRKNVLKEAIDFLLKSKNEEDQKEGQMLKDIYDELDIENANSGKEIFDKANPVVKNVINDFINRFGQSYPEFAKIAQEQFNIILGQDKNYTSDSWRTVGDVDQSSADKLFKKGRFVTNSDIVETEESGKFIKPKYPEKLPTRNGKVYRVPSYNFFKNNMDALSETINTVNTIAGVNQYAGFMDSPYLDKLITDEESRKFFKDRMDFNVSLFQMNEKIGKRNKYFRKAVDIISKYPMKIGTTLGLSSAESVFTQSLPIIANTVTNLRNPAYMGLAAQYPFNPGMRDFLNGLNKGITERGGSSQTNIDYVNNMLESGDYSTPDKSLETMKKAMGFLLEKGLVGTDVGVAKTTWMAYYMDDLAKQGINPLSINWSNHSVNEKAAKYAEKMVEREQNINLPEAGGRLWASGDPNMKAARMFYPFANFTTNQKDKIKTNMAVLFMDNNLATKQEKIAAARSLVATGVEQFVFNSVKSYIGEKMVMGAYNILNKKEDEEQRKLREKKKRERLYRDMFETFSGTNNMLLKEVDAFSADVMLRSLENVVELVNDAKDKKMTPKQLYDKIFELNWLTDNKVEKEKPEIYNPFGDKYDESQAIKRAKELREEIKKPFRFSQLKRKVGNVSTAVEMVGGVPNAAFDTWIKLILKDVPTLYNKSMKVDKDEREELTKEELNKLLYLFPFKFAGSIGFGREPRKLYDEATKIIEEEAKMRNKVRKADWERINKEFYNEDYDK